jgi:myo-inositol-1(or 4)-monophosphatase
LRHRDPDSPQKFARFSQKALASKSSVKAVITSAAMNHRQTNTSGTPTASLAARLTFAEKLARECGALALRESENLNVSSKGPHDVLTQADLAVERLIRDAVASAFPADHVVGEEMGGQADAQTHHDFWLVDPIDGTANYATDVPRWCISIGYLQAGKPVIGILFDPVHDRMYTASLGGGAFLNGKPIRARGTSSLDGATVEMGWSARLPYTAYLQKVEAVMQAGSAFVRRGSGALGLADVASGRVDGYAELHINAWDCAAGILLVTEAGGRANDFFTPQGIQSGGLLVASTAGIYTDFHRLMTA